MLKGRFERMLMKGGLWVLIAFLAGLTLFLAIAVWEIRGKERIAAEEKENARHALQELIERRDTLEEGVAHFESARGIEEEIRKRYPAALPGEEVLVLVDAPEAEARQVATPPPGWWGIIRSWFGNSRD